ncbi:type II toxin-antitoxin system RelE/ParE family toxin [[Mycobacterium] zoologicum]|uniref:type II toxin-antitoxin system RelE/ParE family toxin n=1 Tax=[Mycobacterium] zoologicum TaxID=2872311 RepID=UPI001CDB04EE|nr:type II toxin-antitoxin system RelE/ParE family toxin [Mycolicibacter sp. MYC101]MEB3063197.1 type II toxin-antitoxin system RelE/ParE family toxin [Mycolicibacter sp. MYC101]
MTSRYLLSPAAQADLEQIWDYTHEQWGIDQADEYLREIQYAIARVAANPRIDRTCDEIRLGYRKLSVGSHALFYRLTAEDVVDVIRVLHRRMDTDLHL